MTDSTASMSSPPSISAAFWYQDHINPPATGDSGTCELGCVRPQERLMRAEKSGERPA